MWLSTPVITNGHYGLLMLSLVVVAIMLGFPTAFTLMGMGILFAFFAYHSGKQSVGGAMTQTLDLMVQRAYAVMANDVLIAIPLFVFMGYLVERANLIEKLFKSLHLALARVPGSLGVATLVTCALFATATGIVGAVVTLMGLLALPAMLRAGYSVQLSAGAITAGGCLGILIPPSVLLIVYGATAGVSVVQLYAGAFFPGLMLAGLYIVYFIIVAKLKPQWAPPLSAAERMVPLPAQLEQVGATADRRALPVLIGALKGRRNHGVPMEYLLKQLFIVLLPALVFVASGGPELLHGDAGRRRRRFVRHAADRRGHGGARSPPPAACRSRRSAAAGAADLGAAGAAASGLQEPPGSGGLSEPPGAGGRASRQRRGGQRRRHAGLGRRRRAGRRAQGGVVAATGSAWASAPLALAIYYLLLSFARLEIFKMLLSSFFPLLIMILAVLGSIVFGLATPTEAAAIGASGGFVLAAAYRQLNLRIVQESVFLTAKTTAMVCWLFVGSAIFSAAFALLGGQELVERWVLGMNLSKTEFLIMSQIIIFVLGWPLEWTEIIVIFMPIFIPLLDNFGVDPLFFGLLVALNLQTAFLSPPVAMSAFYLKGVAPRHVTLNQIFAGMMPFMGIQVVAIILLYIFPGIGLWLPQLLYK